tara:strand:- start:6882 stop:7607 length:726 start_codon:yes stop_codon:yes gene_type:complete
MILDQLVEKKALSEKQFAVLIDPDNQSAEELVAFVQKADAAGVGFFLVGGSLLISDQLEATILAVKSATSKPVVIFPGSPMQVNNKADGILLLSLISGRNAEMLIGHHVIAAPLLKRSRLEVLPTGYILVDGGRQTTASFMSGTTPIPADKPDIAAVTAMAGEMLGLKLIYMDAGSGAQNPITAEMIGKVAKGTDVPLIIGGGIRSIESAKTAFDAGADVIVVGNALEKNPEFLNELAGLV